MKAQQILCVLPFFDSERTMYMPSGMSLTEISLLYAFVVKTTPVAVSKITY